MSPPSRPTTSRACALAIVLAMALALLASACSSSRANRVEVVDGATTVTATAALPSIAVPPDIGPPTLSDATTITTVSVGDVAFGEPLEDAQRAAGTAFLPVEGTETCLRARPETGPEGLTFLVVEGTVERADVDAGPVTTRSGAGVGMPVDELRELYPTRLEEGSGPDGAPVLTFVPQDAAEADYRIVFETDGEVVTRFRAGRLPSVTDSC